VEVVVELGARAAGAGGAAGPEVILRAHALNTALWHTDLTAAITKQRVGNASRDCGRFFL
jgi:hypothetical protein